MKLSVLVLLKRVKFLLIVVKTAKVVKKISSIVRLGLRFILKKLLLKK